MPPGGCVAASVIAVRSRDLSWDGACAPQYPALAGERFFRAHYAELVSLRVGQDGPGFSAGLPDVDPARPQRKKAINLLIAVRSAAGEVKVHTVLDSLGLGDRHEAHADGRVLVSPDDDLALALGKNLPAKRLGPEPGQAGQIVSVNDDVVKSDRHADSMRGRPYGIPGPPYSSPPPWRSFRALRCRRRAGRGRRPPPPAG